MKTMTIELTEAEAAELFLVSNAGFGHGDYYGLNGKVRYRSKDWRKRFNAYGRAIEKLQEGRHDHAYPK